MTRRGAGATGSDRVLLSVLIFITLVSAAVSSLGAPLVPTISGAEDVSLETAQWSLTVTLLVATATTPVMGRLADGPHRRTVTMGALVVVISGCVLAALPWGFTWLLVGRALQGVSLGLTPLTIATARQHLPSEKVGPGVAALSLAIVVGVGLGYPVTGLLTAVGGLHAGFWFGAGVSAAALLAAALILPEPTGAHSRRLDLLGALVLAAALGALLLAVTLSPRSGWTSPRAVGLLVGAALLLGSWTWRELTVDHPLVDLRLLGRGQVALADAVSLAAATNNYLLLTLVTILVQTPVSSGYGLGATVTGAGLLLVPFSLAGALAGRVVGPIMRRVGPYSLLPLGSLSFAAGLVVFLLSRSDFVVLSGVLALCGFGTGCTFAALPVLIVRVVPAGETGSAIGFNQVLRYVGFSLGSAVAGTVLARTTAGGAAFPREQSYTVAAMTGLGLALACLVASLVLLWWGPRRATASGSGS